MRRFFGRVENDKAIIEGDELKHLSSVIRLKNGDKFVCVVGDEFDYVCQIERVDKKQAVAKILKKERNISNPQKQIVLFQAITKKEAFETILQKACELGASKVIPFESEFSVNKSSINIERAKTIISSACKQCERSKLMQIENLCSFENMIEQLKSYDLVLFANENEQNNANFMQIFSKNTKKIAIIVGCEGGFSENEVNKIKDAGAISLSLGRRILRADTASILLVGIVSLLSEN